RRGEVRGVARGGGASRRRFKGERARTVEYLQRGRLPRTRSSTRLWLPARTAPLVALAELDAHEEPDGADEDEVQDAIAVELALLVAAVTAGGRWRSSTPLPLPVTCCRRWRSSTPPSTSTPRAT